jgi:putative OPT family oligopeptide transporter
MNPATPGADDEPTLEHKPFVPPEATVRELSFRAVFLGAVLGIIFAFSSVYLGLKVGLTVSASIPIAVLSITLFRWLRMRSTILENNISQTTGSAGESIAAGIAFTLPSLLLMGFDMELMRVLLVGLLGGLIGVLMMIPLRQGLIVKEHGKLAYPEGTACADVLIVGEKGGTQATTVFTGFFVGLIYSFFNLVTKLWSDTATFGLEMGGRLKKAMIAFEVSPPMLGVGYIIGPKVAGNMIAGGLLAFVVLIPLIAQFGGPEVAAKSPYAMRNDYILYIGAGAVATGGFIALFRSIPTIISAFARGMSTLRGGSAKARGVPRTEQDLSMKLVLGGIGAILVAILAAPILQIDFLTAVLIILFGFFFVTVSSRITGEIGSSSNPISGMTIATLLLTCGLFVVLGRTGVDYKAMALTTAALVCVAASNGGTISQDLKTGFLVGATPRHQQVSILVGVVSSAIVIGFTVILLDRSVTTYQAVDHGAFTLPETHGVVRSTQLERAPDGQSYKVAFVQIDDLASGAADGIIPRGKYLLDEAGHLAYFVHAGVIATYPYRLEKDSGPFPALRIAEDGGLFQGDSKVGISDGTDLGLDHKPYNAFNLTEVVGERRPGRYLVDGAGQVAYFSSIVKKYDAPKAQLFRLIIDGTLGGTLPWGLVLIGVFIAIMLELAGLSSLPFAVGLYLPISTSAGIYAGGLVRWLVDRKRKNESSSEAEFSPGMLMASGLIAGGAILGVVNAGLLIADANDVFSMKAIDLSRFLPASLVTNEGVYPMIMFLFMAAALYFVGVKRNKK